MKKFILATFIALNAVYECKIPNVLQKWFQEYQLRYDDDESVLKLQQELSAPENKIRGQIDAKEIELNNGLKSLVAYNTYRLPDSTVENFRALSDWSVDENLNCQKNQLHLAILKHCINQESGTNIRRSPFLCLASESPRTSSPNVFRPLASGSASPYTPTILGRLSELEE